MRRTRNRLEHEFVEFVPSDIESEKVYVSMQYTTAVHKCFCGCGCEVVTPLSPTDWKLIFDGQTISLSPSIGNWSFKCKSHYWIKNNRVVWAESWSDEKIYTNRFYDKINKNYFYENETKNLSYKPTHSNIFSIKKILSRIWPFR